MWILTTSYNDYDQHGDYFVAAWTSKPSLNAVTATIGGNDSLALHILSGGGRRGGEYQWYQLIEALEGENLHGDAG